MTAQTLAAPPTQQNGSVWIDRGLSSWGSASVPVMSDAVLRASSVFDGLLAVRTAGGIGLVAADPHIRRLLRSARVVGLDHDFGADEITHACLEVAAAEARRTGSDVVYVRPMLLGARLTDSVAATSLVVTAFAQPRYFDPPRAVSVQTAALRRPPGDALSSYAKATANYHLTRLARIQAAVAGYDDALFVNSTGRVAEAAGSAVLFEIDGTLCTPPASEDCLPSITVDLVEEVAGRAGVPFTRRPVAMAEAHGADGMALVGTLAAMPAVERLDHVRLQPGTVIQHVRSAYLKALRHRTEWITATRDAGSDAGHDR